ncbi:DUF2779 domain-containing protein [Candidatus Woesearchaeota archaeon]|nr:DUF2779 domain-containing protein [Candidatus Woesearchaeota archaeon]
MPLLTKSKYIVGLSCPRYLWMMFHDLDKIPENDAATQYIIDQGKAIGKLAKKLYPNGIDLPDDPKDFSLNLQKTKVALASRQVLFEAGILVDEIFARADILIPVGVDEWDIVEVKGSTEVKEDHLHDLSFQKYVYTQFGLKIRNCSVLHINKEYVLDGELDVSQLLKQTDVTAQVEELVASLPDLIFEMMAIINSTSPPQVHIGNGCHNGLDCKSEDCWKFLPESHVFELYYGGKKSLELFQAEVVRIQDIPSEFKLTDKQLIQKKCAVSGVPYVNSTGLGKFLGGLVYPLHYLDFETFQTAVPLYQGTKPYQQIPFQFSVHIDDGNAIEHLYYLHDSADDPREKFLSALKEAILPTGTIIVFNQSFEIARLRELAAAFPAYFAWVEEIVVRIVDLIVPFRSFDYYNPTQKGSCSIKEVLPALTGKGYKNLEINNGGLASVSYCEMAFGSLSVEEKAKVRKDLLDYCGLDTEGMVWIVKKLEKLVEKGKD